MTGKASFFAGFAMILAAPAAAMAQVDNAAPVLAQPTMPTDPAVPPAPQPAPPTVVTPVPTPSPVKPPAPKKKGPVDSLRPGQYVWEARASKAQDLKIIAVLDIQRLYVFDGDTVVGVSTMSSGKKGKATPTGVFKILQKNIDHKSNLYSNAPMPYMQRLTWDGIALHAGHIPGYAASHGCLRLPLGFAKALYGATKMDQTVVILPSLDSPKQETKPEGQPEIKPEPVVDTPVPPPSAAPQQAAPQPASPQAAGATR
jgi:lipoprotein-anchoring transpeptidase ErfK/SrfK